MTRRALLIAAGGAAVAAALGGAWFVQQGRRSRLPASMAVLPFRPLASASRNEAIEYGVTELLINRLSMLPGIVVKPLSSVRRYAALEQDAMTAGRALGVAAVVEGYVHIDHDDVQLTARLLDVETGQSLWAGNFREKLGNFFDVQDALVTQIVTALPVELPDAARQRLVAYDTADSEAWQLYANGRYQIERRDQASTLRAKDYFEKAIARDPQFALAITGLSEACALAGTFAYVPPRIAFEEARAAAKRALAIDPNLPGALVALGHVRTQLDHAWEDARRLYHQALALEPRAAWTHSFLALNSVQSGSIATALEHVSRAQALEPAAFPFMALGGFIRYFARQFDASRRELSSVAESVPAAALPRQFFARTLLVQGDAAAVVKLLEGRNDPAPGSYSNLGRAYAMVGRVDDARAQIASLEAQGQQGFGVGYDLAQIHIALGERDRALAALERGAEDGSQMIGYINVDAAIDPVRDDPRVRAVAKRIGLP
jgi:TolB-like protein/Flp pilus assembly protein TadD